MAIANENNQWRNEKAINNVNNGGSERNINENGNINNENI